MLGKNHIITNVCSLVCLSDVLALESNYVGHFAPQVHAITNQFTHYYLNPQINMPMILFKSICILLFLLGTLLPDTDSPNSILGKFIYVPVEHRTWTHSIWPVIVLFGVSIFIHILFWVGLGYLLHLLWDSLSNGGICYFYPISKYKGYGNGAKVKQKHIFKLYKVGSISEYILVGLVVVFTVYFTFKYNPHILTILRI